MKLYFIYMNGCPACEEAKPQLGAWKKKARGVDLVMVDLMAAKWVNPWQPRVTPTYVMELPGHRRVMHEGALTEEQIDKFIRKAHAMLGVA